GHGFRTQADDVEQAAVAFLHGRLQFDHELPVHRPARAPAGNDLAQTRADSLLRSLALSQSARVLVGWNTVDERAMDNLPGTRAAIGNSLLEQQRIHARQFSALFSQRRRLRTLTQPQAGELPARIANRGGQTFAPGQVVNRTLTTEMNAGEVALQGRLAGRQAIEFAAAQARPALRACLLQGTERSARLVENIFRLEISMRDVVVEHLVAVAEQVGGHAQPVAERAVLQQALAGGNVR